MTSAEFFIVEGLCVDSDLVQYQQVKIHLPSMTICQVGKNLGEVDLSLDNQTLLFPGFIDLHVHAREDFSQKHNYKEDFNSMSAAALNGGVVAVMDMPNNSCAPVDKNSFLQKQRLSQNYPCIIVPYVGIGPKTLPIDDLDVAYKVYMGPSIGDLFFKENDLLEQQLAKYQGKQVSFHCEDPVILNQCSSLSTHYEKRPREAEIQAVQFALQLIKKYHLKGIICHLSTKQALESCWQAQNEGVNVSVEVSPHHLYFFQEQDLPFSERLLQVNPPIRGKADRDFLLKAVMENKIEFLATDHAPHTLDEKIKGMSGLTHLDTYGAFVGHLINKYHVSPQTICKIACENPAKIINPHVQKAGLPPLGQIKVGFYGALVALHLTKNTNVTREFLKTKSQWSPFLGQELSGQAEIIPSVSALTNFYKGRTNERHR